MNTSGEAQEHEQYVYAAKACFNVSNAGVILPLVPFFQTFKPPKFYFAGLINHSTINLGNLLIHFHYFKSIFFVPCLFHFPTFYLFHP
jgi:hypothetical protein